MRVRLNSIAESELREAIEFYEVAENGLGAQFLDEVEAAVERIVTNPLAWTQLSPRTRRCRTHRFPFGLFYQIRSDESLITSIADLRRDPKKWKKDL